MKRLHAACLVWHRHVGLAMAVFLAIVALTGSVLAFRDDIERVVAPQLYATAQPGVPALDLATLVEHAQELLPHAEVVGVQRSTPDHAEVAFRPRKDPETGRPYTLGFNQFFIDPWTGKELAHRNRNDISEGTINLLPFILQIHDKLVAGRSGTMFLGILALVWTIDCFVAFFLTFPQAAMRFWHHWKPSWLIRTDASVYRFNLDLHRASGLWLWPALVVFAWSSVLWNLHSVYDPVSRTLFGYESNSDKLTALYSRKPTSPKPLEWRLALEHGQQLMAERAAREGFEAGEPVSISYIGQWNAYTYSSQPSWGSRNIIYFDPDTRQVLFFSGLLL